MAQRRLRVALDANVLIAGIRLPRWLHEVMRASLGDFFDLALPAQVIVEAGRHLSLPRCFVHEVLGNVLLDPLQLPLNLRGHPDDFPGVEIQKGAHSLRPILKSIDQIR